MVTHYSSIWTLSLHQQKKESCWTLSDKIFWLRSYLLNICKLCADLESFGRGDLTLARFLLLGFSWWWMRDPKSTKRGLWSASQRIDYGLTLNAGLIALWFFRGSGAVLKGNPIALWFFREGGPDLQSPLWIRACKLVFNTRTEKCLCVLGIL